nr:SHOCT domain-containing protein [Staphylococcus aureus]
MKGIQKETSKTVENKKIVENDIELESLKKIKLLKELLDIEAITQEEYDAKKKKLLGL